MSTTLVANPSTRRRSTRATTRLGTAAISYVFTLCLPYVDASPLPSTDDTSSVSVTPVDTPDFAGTTWSLSTVLDDIGNPQPLTTTLDPDPGGTRDAWFHRTLANPTMVVPAAGDGHGPIIALAQYNNMQGAYRVPDNFYILNQHFHAGFIVLSYMIAFVGSLCTLELLIRRTTNTGWRNRTLLTAAGFTFGAVSTFAMHFIFNNSLSLHVPGRTGGSGLHLAYSPGFTVLSLVSSCLAMTFAFFVMATRLQDWWFLPWIGRWGQRKRRSRLEQEQITSGSTRSSKSSIMTQKRSSEVKSQLSGSGKQWRRSSSKIEDLFNQAGSIAKWSLVQPTPSTSPTHNRKWSDGKWRKSSADSKMENRRSSWARYAEGESTERICKPRGSHEVQSARLQDLAKNNASTGSLSLELVDSKHSGPTLNVEHDRGVENSYFTPGYDFPSPATDPEPVLSGHPHLPSRATPRSDEEQASPLSRPQPLPSLPDATPESGGPATPATNADLSGRRGSLPVLPLTNRQVTLLRHNTLTRISSLPEGDDHHTPASSNRSSRAIMPEKPGRNSTSSMNGRTSSFAPSRPDEVVPLQGGSVMTGSSGKRHYSRLETFFGLDVLTQNELIKLCVTGTIAGFGVAAMHYIGQLSIIEIPYIAYKVRYIIGSVIIACGAVTIALYIMFIMLRPKLKHTWIAKIVVAAILAAAVSGMHFTGMMGTIYAWKRGQRLSPDSILRGTNRAITAIVAALAFGACVACTVFFVLHSLRQRRERARRRRVVVAAVMIDENDRILVGSTDGMLPMCDIANLTGDVGKGTMLGSGSRPGSRRSTSKSMGDLTTSDDSSVLGMDLTPGHEAFINALKTSWSWRSTSGGELTSQEKELFLADRLGAYGPSETGRRGSTTGSTGSDRRESGMTMASSTLTATSRHMTLSVAKFLDKFSTSSRDLSLTLNGHLLPLSRLGVLYDQILTTGWVKLDHSNDTVSKGQLIFLVRRVTSPVEQTSLLTRQYIFAEPSAVAGALHKTLSVPYEHAMPLLEDIRQFCDSTIRAVPEPSKLFAGVAIVQATPFDGLRVLLEKNNRAQLPMRELCSIIPSSSGQQQDTTSVSTQDDLANALTGTLEELGEAMTWLEGMSLMSIITRNMSIASNPSTSPAQQLGGSRVTALLRSLERAIVPMLDEMLSAEDMAHILPRLFLHPVLVPLTPDASIVPPPKGTTSPHGSVSPASSVDGSRRTPAPYVVVFYANYDAAVNTYTDKWLPFNLFRAQNGCVMAQTIADATTQVARAHASNVVPLPPSEARLAQSPVPAQSPPFGPYSMAAAPPAGGYTVDGSQVPASTTTPALGELATMYSRRPSRVQFELKSTSPGSHALNLPLPSPSTTIPPSLDSPTGNGISGMRDYAFPPVAPLSTSMTTSTGPESSEVPTRQQSPVTPTAPTPIFSTASPSATQAPQQQRQQQQGTISPLTTTADRPRKSSLAQKSRFDEPRPPLDGVVETGPPQGVAAWEPDWLLILLRTKLRTDMDM